MRLFLREASDCKAGTQWWVCNSPQYRGCCSVDACHRGGCPDEPSRTITATPVDPTNTSSATQSTITASPLASTTSSSAIISSSTATSVAGASKTTSYPSIVYSTLSPTLPVVFPTESAASGSTSHKGAIIGGSVAGAVALALIAVMLWYCCRKRKNGRAATSQRTEPKRPSYREMNAEEVQRLSPHDVFAPFGGYQRSNSMQERSASNTSIASQQTVIINRVARPVSELHEEDVPIRDMEKSSLPAPPLDDHPAMHPLPGQSPEVPAYHPGQEITSPELAKHPAYLAKHPSLVNRNTARSSTTDPMSANLRLHPKTNLTFPFMNLVSSNKRSSKENRSSDSFSTLPSQRRRDRLSKTFLRRSYTPISTTQSSSSKQTQLPLQDDNSPIPGRSELPAVVPQELSSTPARKPTDRLDMFKVAADRRMRCSPIGLGVKSPSTSSSPLHISTVSPPPFFPPQNTTTTEGIVQTPTAPYHPSPRSANSPALKSDFYQTHIVSPEAPPNSGQFIAYGHTFDRKAHVSQMQIPASRSSPQKPLRHRASHPPDPHSFSPSPQRPRIDTGVSAQGMKRKIKHKESLGKGKENVMSWAIYNRSTASSLLSTPPKSDEHTRDDSPPALQSPQANQQKEEDEQESPILPPFFLHPERRSAMLVNGKEMQDRWSGSTATTSATKDEHGEMMSSAGTIIDSPSVYSNDGEGNRYSRVDRMSTTPAATVPRERGVCGLEV